MGGLGSWSKMEGDGGVLSAKRRWWLGMIPVFFFFLFGFYKSTDLKCCVGFYKKKKTQHRSVFFFLDLRIGFCLIFEFGQADVLLRLVVQKKT